MIYFSSSFSTASYVAYSDEYVILGPTFTDDGDDQVTWEDSIIDTSRSGWSRQNNCFHSVSKNRAYPIPSNRDIHQAALGGVVYTGKSNHVIYQYGFNDIYHFNLWYHKFRDHAYLPEYTYTHNVCVPFQIQGVGPGIAFYYGSYNEGYGKIHPTWKIMWWRINNRVMEYYICTPSSQGYNQYPNHEDQLVSSPKFTESQLGQIRNAWNKWCNGYKSTVSGKSVGEIPSGFRPPSLHPTVFPISQSDLPYMGDLMADAVSDLGNFNGNGLALASDLRELSESARSTVEALKTVADKAPAKVASLYLAFHYGWKLLASDLHELYESLRSISLHRRIGAAQTFKSGEWSGTSRLSVYYTDDTLINSIQQLASKLDLEPTLDNIWDMIPYSFVVDWVLNIGDLATVASNYYTLVRDYRIRGSIISHKCTRTAMYTIGGVAIEAQQKVYIRNCMKAWAPIPTPSLESTIPDLQHSVEAGALIVSRL